MLSRGGFSLCKTSHASLRSLHARDTIEPRAMAMKQAYLPLHARRCKRIRGPEISGPIAGPASDSRGVARATGERRIPRDFHGALVGSGSLASRPSCRLRNRKRLPTFSCRAHDFAPDFRGEVTTATRIRSEAGGHPAECTSNAGPTSRATLDLARRRGLSGRAGQRRDSQRQAALAAEPAAGCSTSRGKPCRSASGIRNTGTPP